MEDSRPPDLSVVLACYNEMEHLEHSFREIRETLVQSAWPFEILFVDDVSRDGTREILKEIVESHRRLHAGLASSPALVDVDRATKALGKVLKRLQQELVATRLLPVSTVFRKFAATVRDLAREHGKMVRLSMSGADTPGEVGTDAGIVVTFEPSSAFIALTNSL